MNSLRRRLLLWLLPATFAAGALASVGTYWGALLELDDLLNDQMRYIARHVSLAGEQVSFDERNSRLSTADEDKADEVLLQIWDGHGQLHYSSDPALQLPAPSSPGLSDVPYREQTWHTFVEQRGDRLIRVAQAQDARWEALAGLAVHLLWPVLSLLPLLALFLWFGIGYGLKPLHRIVAELAQRNASSLVPIADIDLPREVRPLVAELNSLLKRLDQAFTQQKDFIADAAHELRTPIMALSLQADLARRAESEGERRSTLAQLQAGVTRLAHLSQQLLTLARLEPQAQDGPWQPVPLLGLCKSVIADQIHQAEAKAIDLGLSSQDDACVRGDPEALRILLNNLVDNAIRHSPGGTIDLAVRREGDGAILEVTDDGPGIPEAERARVLERFYRGAGQKSAQGSGLGLSIVARIAERHGARLSFGPGADGRGLQVRVHFPAVASARLDGKT
ncbi:ATP-binding protein [Pseudomonas panipatensis]|uniref:histidine kinase n=1 Tax=Pseudomonas panipatensis TaxID=428992 RepID=A0A1G8BFD8_9PSED|nr:ATP-binding protein [Pseudomonas panipatensis]SDH31945.1 Signal transduction histidine kinase [Pseudomonas panipatensis]SMP71040.1 Signal transduction histidine kinase [Pseudomonas panipatensis]